MTTIPAYTIDGLTRPELQLDSTGHIVLDAAAQAFADTYGLQYLYLGCPPGTLWPPVTDQLSAPIDANAGNNTVIEGAAANTLVNITALATSSSGHAVTYSLIGDSSGGGFKIDPNTGVVTVADPAKINYVTSPGHAYTITVQASDGIATSAQSFAIAVTDVAPSTPVDSNAAANKVAEGAVAGTAVGITATSADMNPVTYSLTGDSSGGGFTINATTGVITVADPSKINYVTAPGHAYTVTATASDGTLSSSQTFSIDVTLGAATHFAVSIPANGAAGTPGTVTVTALDALNHVVTNYTGTVHFRSTDSHAALPADVTLTNGTGSFSETLDTAGSQTITATDTVTGITGTSNAEAVTPGAATHFAVSLPANGTAGTPGSFTVTALDAFNNVATGYIGTVHFSSSDGSATLPADMTLTNGTGTFSETFKTAGNQTITANDLVTPAIAGSSNAEAVAGGTATHLVVSIPASGAAGTPGLVTVTAFDAFGNVATGYSGTVHFTSSDGHAVLPADMTLTNGTGSFSETFETVGSQTITATDTVSAITSTSNAETVTPGPVTHFSISIPGSSTAGIAGSGTVTALDAFGNVVTGYTGTVHFTSTDGHAILPADMTLTNGTATFSETLDTAGSQTITATDTVTSTITGTSNAEAVTAAAATHFAVSIPGSGSAGTPGSGTVTALDAFGNVVLGYTGTVHFTSTDGSAVLPADMTLTNGTGTFNETFDTSGSQTITATDTVSAITGTSNAENVAPGPATHFAVSIPANGRADVAGSVTVTALDAHGNIATGYTGTVHFTSSDPTAVLPSDATLTGGIGTFTEKFETAGSQTITATDTVSAGVTGTSNTETVAPPDAPPVVTGGHILNYIEGQAATAFDPALTVTDADSATLDHVTVQITGNYFNGQDILAFVNTAHIVGAWDALHGELTLTGTAGSTVADFQTALDSITYFNSSNNPSGLARTVTITANDGTLDGTPVTDTIDVTPVNNPPVVTIGAITNFSEPPVGTPPANSIPVTIAPNLTITDVDSTNLISATFELTDLKPSDALSIAGHAGTSGDIGNIHFDITSTATTETVTLTGTDTIAHYNAVLDAVQFNNTGEPPDTTARTYTVTAVDDGGTANGGNDTGSASATQTVTAIDDPPTATVPSDSSVGTAFSHTNLAISGLSVADIDSAGGNETATITSNHGALSFDTTGLAGFTNNGSHTVTLTGTIAQLNTALATLTYNSDDGFTGSDTVSLNINDNGHTGSGGPLSSGPQSFHVGVVPQVFYIDNSATSSHNLGTQADPYTSIAAFNAANPAGSGDYVVLEHGTGTYSEANGINLANGVNLIGGSHTLTFTNPVTNQLVTANVGSGADPVIHVTGADNGIDLLGTTGHTITGVSIDTSASTGIGISDDGNNVGTVTMSDIVIKTASGAGLSFTHGGTITVTGSNNTITSTTGTALDVEHTNIGTGSLTFKSISATGSSGNAGIILDTTGTAGGLTVTGTGSAGSGGTINNKTGGDILSGTDAGGQTTSGDGGTGIFLHNTANVSLTDMALHDFSNFAIYGNGVTNFTLANSAISGTNGTTNAGDREESSIRFDNLLGTASITGSSISGGFTQNVDLYNTSGTLNRLTMDSDTFGLIGSSGNDNVLGQVYNSATANYTVTNSTFSGTRSDFIAFAANNNSSMDAVVRSNTFHNGEAIVPGGGTAVHIASGSGGNVSAATTTFDISHNILTDGGANAFDTVGIFVSKGQDNGTMSGTIASNDIGPAKVGSNSDGIFVRDAGAGSLTTLIQNNTITGVGDAGIALQNNDGSSTLNATLYGNSVSSPTSNSPFAALDVENGATATDTSTTNIVIGMGGGGTGSKNTLNHSTLYATDVELSNFNASTHLNLSKNGSTSGTAAGVITDDNTSTTGGITVDTTGGNGTTTLVSTLPTLPAVVAPLLAEAGGVQASTPSTGEMHLTQAELSSVVSAAIAEWASAGANATQLALLHAATFSVADLAGQIVGQEGGLQITIDTDAAGHGWFIDPTLSDNFEFTNALNAAGTDLLTDPSKAAAGHLDLLTTVVHELGHVLGLPDSVSPSDANSLMYIGLADGERRLATASDVAQSNTALQKAMPMQGTSTSNQQTTTSQTTGTPKVTSGDSFDFSSLTQTQSQTNTSHTDLTANTQTLSDLFGGHSSAATPWWAGHEMTYAAMGGNLIDHLQTHHDLVV
ncbi:beta strand repeat-containing protein [Bradyrhizobium embrapense]